jgi:hypothetical protein
MSNTTIISNPLTDPVDDGLPVKLPSGVEWRVLNKAEVAYVKERVKLYTTSFKFVNVSDLADCDRVIMLETLSHRMGTYLSIGRDYWGDPVPDENALRSRLSDLSGELRLLKKSMRLDKASRSADDDTDTISYLEMLRVRAKAFGIMRDEQCAKAIELMQQIIALIQLYRNCTEQERKEMQATPEALMDWLWDKMRPEFEAVDKHFREVNRSIYFPIPGEGL